MSPGGAFTDFHIDAGGSSAWYNILQGKKVFWLIPPTDANLKMYEEWQLSCRQQQQQQPSNGGGSTSNSSNNDGEGRQQTQSVGFFADRVDSCARFELVAGHTLFIPGGWIHAVYTVQDTIMFGGNFLHSFCIERQLQAVRLE